MQEYEAQLLKLGFRIIAMSPDRPQRLAETVKKNKLQFDLYSDSELQAASAMGLSFRLDDGTLAKLKSYNIDIHEASGKKHNMLPVPAAFLIDTEGTIHFAYSDPDYTKRVSVKRLLEVARGLQVELESKK